MEVGRRGTGAKAMSEKAGMCGTAPRWTSWVREALCVKLGALAFNAK